MKRTIPRLKYFASRWACTLFFDGGLVNCIRNHRVRSVYFFRVGRPVMCLGARFHRNEMAHVAQDSSHRANSAAGRFPRRTWRGSVARPRYPCDEIGCQRNMHRVIVRHQTRTSFKLSSCLETYLTSANCRRKYISNDHEHYFIIITSLQLTSGSLFLNITCNSCLC